MAYIKIYIECERHMIMINKTGQKGYYKITAAHARSKILDPNDPICQKCQKCLRK